MATYFVNAGGTNTPPFSSAGDGATTFASLLANETIASSDIIEVVDNGVIDDSAALVDFAVFPNNVTFRSWSGNSNNPTVKVLNTSLGIRFDTNRGPMTGCKWQNIDVYKEGPSAAGGIIGFSHGSYVQIADFEISGCEMYVANTTGMSNVYGIYNNNNVSNTNLQILNNTIHDVTTAVQIEVPQATLTIENNYFYDLDTSSGVGIDVGGGSGGAYGPWDFSYNKILNAYRGVYVHFDGSLTGWDTKNNIIAHTNDAIYHASTSGTVQSVYIMNNSIYDCVIYGIRLHQIDVNNRVANNILHGNATGGGYTNTGIYVGSWGGGSNSCFYNDVYDFNTAYAGAASAGTGSIASDPAFKNVGTDDYKLGASSTCIEAGAGSGTYAEVPSDDYRGQSRPVVIPGYTAATNGTDIGAYEMLANELQVIYYINASGSNAAPYDSSNTGAVNLGTLLSNISYSGNDIVNVVQDGGVIDDSTNNTALIEGGFTLRSDASNVGKPTFHVHDSTSFLKFADGAARTTVEDLILIKQGPDATSDFIHYGADLSITSLDIIGCEFSISNTSGADARGVYFNDNSISSDGTIKGNFFDDLTDGVFSFAPESDTAPLAMHYSRIMRTRMTGVMVAPPA